jgi:transglutaminase-like putative cysteine protease
MLYDISLKLSYEYEQAAQTGRHVLRVMPCTLSGEQSVLTSMLSITPDVEERSGRVDFFGNNTVEIACRLPHKGIVFDLKCQVDRHPVLRGDIASPLLGNLASEIAACRSLDPASPHHFLGRSARVRPSAEMDAYTATQVREGMSVVDAVLVVARALHRDMVFDAKATTVDTSPDEAFALRRGVCQDFAHIMIACLRGAGIPAGYVSGFLRTIPPKGKARLAGADAMHAWVRAWCGASAGWVEIDPTNNLLVAEDHVVIARGRDYSDVAPVKGVLRTSGSQTSVQAVDVVALG